MISVQAGSLDLAGSWTLATTATSFAATGATLTGDGVIAADTLAHSGGSTVRLTGPNLLDRLSTSGNRAALTLTGGRGTPSYDGTLHRNGYAVSGVVAGDSVTGVAGLASGRNAGSYRDALLGRPAVGCRTM